MQAVGWASIGSPCASVAWICGSNMNKRLVGEAVELVMAVIALRKTKRSCIPGVERRITGAVNSTQAATPAVRTAAAKQRHGKQRERRSDEEGDKGERREQQPDPNRVFCRCRWFHAQRSLSLAPGQWPSIWKHSAVRASSGERMLGHVFMKRTTNDAAPI